MTFTPATEEVVFCLILASYILITRFLPSIIKFDIRNTQSMRIVAIYFTK